LRSKKYASGEEVDRDTLPEYVVFSRELKKVFKHKQRRAQKRQKKKSVKTRGEKSGGVGHGGKKLSRY